MVRAKAIYPKDLTAIYNGDWNNGEYQRRNGIWYLEGIEIRDKYVISLLDNTILDKNLYMPICDSADVIKDEKDRDNALDRRVPGDFFRG